MDDEKEFKKRKSKHDLWREQVDEELKALVNTPGGAYFIARLLDQAGVYQAAESMETNWLAFSEGKRDLGRWIIAELGAIDENLYTKVRNEWAKRKEGEK